MSAQRAVLGAGLISAVAVVSEPSYTDGDYTPQCLTQIRSYHSGNINTDAELE